MDMGNAEEEVCNTRLQLGLGLGRQYYEPKQKNDQAKEKPLICLDLWFALCPKQHHVAENNHIDQSIFPSEDNLAMTAITGDQQGRPGVPNSAESCEYPNNNGGGRKKLKLTKDQSTVLEDCFKSHQTLNPDLKQALAVQLSLKPRQVEVWFQNRRARTKLKQTVKDYELLKKCCESLSQENRKLRKELQELRTLKDEPCSDHELFHTRFPNTAKLVTCPSCKNMRRNSRSPSC